MQKINVFILLICFIVSSCFIETGYCRLNRLNRNKVANGLITTKAQNVKNSNNCEILYLTSGAQYAWCDQVYDYEKRSFFDRVLIGDSIIKKKGSLEMYVYRKDTSFIIDLSFPCNK